MSLPAPWAIAMLTREPVGHQRGTPKTPDTSERPWTGSGSWILTCSKRADGSTTKSLWGGYFITREAQRRAVLSAPDCYCKPPELQWKKF